MIGGKPNTVAYVPGPTGNNGNSGVNPFAHTYLHGPFNYEANISLFKVFRITERTNLRMNVDAFNIQGNPNPNGSTGVQRYKLTNYWSTARQLQITARLTF